jgi:hypothetical protein
MSCHVMSTEPYGIDCCGRGNAGCCGACCDGSFNRDAFDEDGNLEETKADAQGPVKEQQQPATANMSIPNPEAK